MGGWRMEAGKMFVYLLFPVGAYVVFNHPKFYELNVRNSMESMSRDINLDNLAQIEQRTKKGEIDKLGNIIKELDTNNKTSGNNNSNYNNKDNQ